MVVAQVLKRTLGLLCNTSVTATHNDESACIEQGCLAVGLQAGLLPISDVRFETSGSHNGFALYQVHSNHRSHMLIETV